jgi:hypothetical protein
MFPIVFVCDPKVWLYVFVNVYICGPNVLRLRFLMLASCFRMFSTIFLSPPNVSVCVPNVFPHVFLCVHQVFQHLLYASRAFLMCVCMLQRFVCLLLTHFSYVSHLPYDSLMFFQMCSYAFEMFGCAPNLFPYRF